MIVLLWIVNWHAAGCSNGTLLVLFVMVWLWSFASWSAIRFSRWCSGRDMSGKLSFWWLRKCRNDMRDDIRGMEDMIENSTSCSANLVRFGFGIGERPDMIR